MGKIMSKIKTLFKKDNATIETPANEQIVEITDEIEFVEVQDEENIETINITEVIEQNKESETKRQETDKTQDDVTTLLTKIYCGISSIDEIQNTNLDSFTKDILKIAYYDKQNRNDTGVSFIKKIKHTYKDEVSKIKILNNLQGIVSSKKGIFDYKNYAKYLDCTIDSNLAIKIFESQKEEYISQTNNIELRKEEPKIKEKISSTKVEPTIKKDTNISFVGNKVNSRYSSNEVIKARTLNTNVNTIEPTLLIKHYFEDEILEIGKILYVQMQDEERQKDAIKAWDKLEVLINKDVNDKVALTRMINLLERINQNCDGVFIEYDKNKCKKLLDK